MCEFNKRMVLKLPEHSNNASFLSLVCLVPPTNSSFSRGRASEVPWSCLLSSTFLTRPDCSIHEPTIVLQCKGFSRYDYSRFLFWVNNLLFGSFPGFRPSPFSGSLKIRAVQTLIRASPMLSKTHSLVSDQRSTDDI